MLPDSHDLALLSVRAFRRDHDRRSIKGLRVQKGAIIRHGYNAPVDRPTVLEPTLRVMPEAGRGRIPRWKDFSVRACASHHLGHSPSGRLLGEWSRQRAWARESKVAVDKSPSHK